MDKASYNCDSAVREAVARAEKDSTDITKLEMKDRFFEARRLRFSDPSCITCHPTRKLNDVAGTMVYMVTKPQ